MNHTFLETSAGKHAVWKSSIPCSTGKVGLLSCTTDCKYALFRHGCGALESGVGVFGCAGVLRVQHCRFWRLCSSWESSPLSEPCSSSPPLWSKIKSCWLCNYCFVLSFRVSLVHQKQGKSLSFNRRNAALLVSGEKHVLRSALQQLVRVLSLSDTRTRATEASPESIRRAVGERSPLGTA